MSEQVRTLLRSIYWAYVGRGFDRDSHLEAWLEIGDAELAPSQLPGDDMQDYQDLFSDASREPLVRELQRRRFLLDGKRFEDCEQEIAALRFLAFIGARGMWHHRLDIGGELEKFTRAFERLDVVDEQRRLHSICQMRSGLGRPLN